MQFLSWGFDTCRCWAGERVSEIHTNESCVPRLAVSYWHVLVVVCQDVEHVLFLALILFEHTQIDLNNNTLGVSQVGHWDLQSSLHTNKKFQLCLRGSYLLCLL